MSITFSGLSSGLDSASMVDQLVAVEKQRATAVGTKVNQLNRQGNILDDLTSRLQIFGTAAKGFKTAAELRSVKVDRSDTTHAAIAASSVATDSAHTLRVASTARGQTIASRTFPADAPGILGDGSVVIDSAPAAPITVSWTAADSLSAIAQRINDTGSGATASVLFDGTSWI
jgi:flagellar hook-associated protein 2